MIQIDFNKKVYLRDIIGSYMVELGEKDESVVLVNADLMGTCRNRSFAEKFPERSFNMGIAEQNMVSFAAGLAHEGFKPYAFSMAPFISMRACEQCRTDVAYSNLNVRLIATYAGCSGGISGATHWGMEDVSIMCGMPNMTVLEPCDEIQAKKMMEATLAINGPVYIRSSVEPMIGIYNEEYEFETGKAAVIKEGTDGAFLCAGVTVRFALQAAINIAKNVRKSISVIDMATIKPIDREAIRKAAQTGRILVAQDHNRTGGLGAYTAQVLAEEGITCRFAVAGIPDAFVAMAHAPYLYKRFGYDAAGLESKMLEMLQN